VYIISEYTVIKHKQAKMGKQLMNSIDNCNNEVYLNGG